MAAMQAQIQVLLAAVGIGGGTATGSNTGAHMEVAKPAIFNREAGKVGGFILACKLYIRNRMRGDTVGVIICAGRIGGCVEGKCNGGNRSRRGGV